MKTLWTCLLAVVLSGCGKSIQDLQAQRSELERSKRILMADINVLDKWLDPKTDRRGLAEIKEAMEEARGGEFVDVALKNKLAAVRQLDIKLDTVNKRLAQ